MSDDRKTLENAVKEVFATHAGEHLMKYLMSEYVYNWPSQNDKSSLFQSGQRSVVIELFHMANED